MKTNQTEEPILIIICRNARQNNAATVLKERVSFTDSFKSQLIATEKTIFDILKFILDHIWLRGFGGIKEIMISFLLSRKSSRQVWILIYRNWSISISSDTKGALSLLFVAHQHYSRFVPWRVRSFFYSGPSPRVQFDSQLFWNVFFLLLFTGYVWDFRNWLRFSSSLQKARSILWNFGSWSRLVAILQCCTRLSCKLNKFYLKFSLLILNLFIYFFIHQVLMELIFSLARRQGLS